MLRPSLPPSSWRITTIAPLGPAACAMPRKIGWGTVSAAAAAALDLMKSRRVIAIVVLRASVDLELGQRKRQQDRAAHLPLERVEIEEIGRAPEVVDERLAGARRHVRRDAELLEEQVGDVAGVGEGAIAHLRRDHLQRASAPGGE